MAQHRLLVLIIVLFTLLTRLAYVPGGVMGFDGPAYINSLKLDSTFNVPMPGNIGYVLLARAFVAVGVGDPVWAYGLVAAVLSAVAAAYVYLCAGLLFERRLAFAVALATMTNTLVWYHGVIMQSYIVWLAALPAIGYHGARFAVRPGWGRLVAASAVTGGFTILRPDLVVFGGPLLGACLLIAWQRDGWAWRHLAYWAGAAGVCAACCCVWFFATAGILGGVEVYLSMVRGKNAWHDTFGVGQKGLVEGLARNMVKYATFMLWGAHVALVPAAVGLVALMRRNGGGLLAGWTRAATPPVGRGALALIAAAWLAPSLYFAWIIFMGNAGLVFPATPLVYIAAAAGAVAVVGSRRAVWVVAALAAVNAGQFVLTPILELKDQRSALVNHMFFGYSGRGLRRMYTYQLEDFGIDRSLRNTMKQFMDPEPLPKRP